MGVLDAWIGADKVGYPVVGEKIKDADNVIDYNIREEVTKDMSAEINANNQTTTGMATIIPGVNAPKLIASTSIIGDLLGGGGGISSSTMQLRTSARAQTGSYSTLDTLVSSDLSPEISIDSGKIYSSTGGTYLITFNIKSWNANVTSFSFICRNVEQDIYVVETECSGGEGTITALAQMDANNYLRCLFEPVGNSCNPTLDITMIRLG